MKSIGALFRRLIRRSPCRTTAIWVALLATAGCGESAEAIHKAADAVTGNQAVRESLRMREQIHGIQEARDSRLKSVMNPTDNR